VETNNYYYLKLNPTMPGNLYYVYWKWSRPADPARADSGRWLLIFESRQKADEFYRSMAELKSSNGKKLFTILHRSTAQFWCFDTTSSDAFWEPKRILEADDKWNFNVQLCLLNDLTGRDWPMIHNVNDGADWINGGAFFIRNRRKEIQNQYWHWNGSIIEVCTTRRTKFIVRAIAMNRDEKQVMIRTDKVTIEVIDDTGATNTHFLEPCSTNAVVVASDKRHEWNFGDFFSSFGTNLHATPKTEMTGYTSKHAIVYAPAIADSWELV